MYEELVKALRCCKLHIPCEECPRYGRTGNLCISDLHDDAATAIEELQAENTDLIYENGKLKMRCDDLVGELAAEQDGRKFLMPKRGEWIFKGTGGSMGYKTCSVCGYQSWQSKLDLGNMGNYCPNCGAKMEVQE